MKANKKFTNDFLKLCENLNWNVTIDSHEKDETCFSLQRYTNFGQDFFFYAYYDHDNERSLYNSIYDYYEAYDTDAEAALWLDECGHGRNGAPYRMSDLLADMQEVENELEKLADAVFELIYRCPATL